MRVYFNSSVQTSLNVANTSLKVAMGIKISTNLARALDYCVVITTSDHVCGIAKYLLVRAETPYHTTYQHGY